MSEAKDDHKMIYLAVSDRVAVLVDRTIGTALDTARPPFDDEETELLMGVSHEIADQMKQSKT